MLAYVLALIVGLGSFALYMAAFFFPEIHRKHDLIWSGVGLFYALVLWVCAGRITGGVLLGQVAGVALLGWLGWQTVVLRRQTAPLDQHTPLPTGEQLQATWATLTSPEGRSQVTSQVSKTLLQIKEGVTGAIAARRAPAGDNPAQPPEYVPPKLEEFGTAGQEAIAQLRDSVAAEPAKLAAAADDLGITADELAAAEMGLVADTSQTTEAIAPTVEPEPKAENAQQATPQATEEQSRPRVAPSPRMYPARPTPTMERSRPAQTERAIVPEPPKKATGIKAAIETVQALLTGMTQKKPSQPVYVRKEFRAKDAAGTEAVPPSAPGTKPGSKPVYVRKAFREQEPGTPSPAAKPKRQSDAQSGSRPAYVRKAFRDQGAEPPSRALDEIEVPFEPIAPTESQLSNSPSTPPVENEAEAIAKPDHLGTTGTTENGDLPLETLTPGRSQPEPIAEASCGESADQPVENGDTTVENVSEAIAPDLLGHAPPEIPAEVIVEELLEEISAQEAAVEPEQ